MPGRSSRQKRRGLQGGRLKASFRGFELQAIILNRILQREAAQGGDERKLSC